MAQLTQSLAGPASHRLLRPRPRFVSAPWLAALLGVLMTLWLAHLAIESGDQVSQLRDRLILQQHRRQQQPNQAERQRQDAQQHYWAGVKRGLAFPWPTVFVAIESGDRPDIELDSFAIDQGKRSLVLKGTARERSALLRYAADVSSVQALAGVRLREERQVARGSGRALAFELEAQIK